MLGIGDVGGNVVVGLWPAELKEQAKYLYGRRLGRPMVAAARERGWTAEPSPHLAFRNASPTVRLYMAPHVDAAEYARRWEEGDLERVGAHAREDVRDKLWPWLKSGSIAPARSSWSCFSSASARPTASRLIGSSAITLVAIESCTRVYR